MAVRINQKGVTFAQSLISAGKIDDKSDWSFKAADGNALLGPDKNNWAEYAKYHLAEDTEEALDTKARWKYAFGKDGKIYRRGVIAAKSRAAQQGEMDIEEAADELLEAIDEKLGLASEDDKDGCGKKKNMMDSVSRVDYAGENNWLVERFTKTPEGYLTGRAVVTNVGVFPYQQKDGSVRRELRLPEEVFAQESLKSLCMSPLTNNHPNEAVNVDNIKQYQVGFVGDSIMCDPYHVSAPITITDAEAIKQAEMGKRALSCGYTVDLEDAPGVWMGVPYDAIQRNIRYNHVAVVDRGRAGDAAVIKLDSVDAIGTGVNIDHKSKTEDLMLKKINLDGMEYEAEETVIKALVATKSKVDALEKEATTNKDALSTVTAERDSLKDQVEALKKDCNDLKAAQPGLIDSAVKARIALVGAATKAGIEVKEDMSDEAIKKAVIVKAFPKSVEKLEKADAAYISARYDAALEYLDERANVADKNKADAGEIPPAAGTQKELNADQAHAKMVEAMKNAYKIPEVK